MLCLWEFSTMLIKMIYVKNIEDIVTEWIEVSVPPLDHYIPCILFRPSLSAQILLDRARLHDQLVQPAGIPWADSQHPSGPSDSAAADLKHCWAHTHYSSSEVRARSSARAHLSDRQPSAVQLRLHKPRFLCKNTPIFLALMPNYGANIPTNWDSTDLPYLPK